MSKPIIRRVATGTAWGISGARSAASSNWDARQNGSSGISMIGSTAAASSYLATFAITKIPGVTTGDVGYTLIALKTGRSITSVPTGWVLVANRSAGASVSLIYRKIMTASEPASYSWTPSAGGGVFHHLVFRGLDVVAPESAQLTNGGYVITSFGLGPYTPTTANSAFLMLGALAADSGVYASTNFIGDPTMTMERISRSDSVVLGTFYEIMTNNRSFSRGIMISPVAAGGATCGIVLNGM